MSQWHSGMMRKLPDDEKVALAQSLFSELETEDSFRLEGIQAYDFLSGHQWDEKEVKVLASRGQPAMVFNLIKPVVNSIEALQKGNRSEISFKAEDSSGYDFMVSKTCSIIAKHDMRKVNFASVESEAFRDYLVTGRGATVSFYDDKKERIGFEKVDFRNLYIDKASKKDDLTDCSHLHIADYVSVAEVNAMFGEDFHGGEGYGNLEDISNIESDRVRIVYTWTKIPVANGSIAGFSYEYDCLVWKDGKLLAYYENPYPQIDGYPVDVMTLYRDLDNIPYGLVRAMIDPQRAYNHARSKIAHILNTRKFVFREGAFDGSDVELAQKLSKVDAVIGLENGAEDLSDITQGYDIQHLWQMANESKYLIREVAGLSDELQGGGNGQLSGKAIKLRQDSGIMRLTEVFDGLAQWKIQIGKSVLGIILGNYSIDRVARLLTTGGEKEFENDEERAKAVKLWSAINPNGLEEYDIVHSTDAVAISKREEEQNNLLQIYSMNPEALPLEAIISNSDMTNKDEILAIMNQQNQLKQGFAQAQQQIEQMTQQNEQVQAQHEAVVQELQSKNERLEGSIMKMMQKQGSL